MTISPTSNPSPIETPNPTHEILDVKTTNCCIVGGGPGGAVLALMLALVQQRVLVRALNSSENQPFQPPALLRLPIFRDLPARLIGLGVFPVHVKA